MVDRNQKIEDTIDELFESVCTVDITPEARDAYENKKALLESLKEI